MHVHAPVFGLGSGFHSQAIPKQPHALPLTSAWLHNQAHMRSLFRLEAEERRGTTACKKPMHG